MKKYFFYILFIGLLQSCANVSAPTGGKKDETPPQVLRTLPVDKSRNFTGQTLELVFDEYIQVDNLKQELLITPDIEGNYELKPIKNGFRLVFDKPFLPNTTYTFNFRNAIKDVTEKNVADQVKIVFSTGQQLDSLYIDGKVTDLLTGKPAENLVVSLYRISDTLDIVRHKPFYFTKTDTSGNYLLENLRSDIYRIYALGDKNNNLKYDGQTLQKEKIAFRPDSIVLDSSYQNINFAISIMDAVAPRITGRTASPNFFELAFDEGLQRSIIEYANQPAAVFNLIDNGKKLRIYNTTNQTDSIPIQITAVDSVGNELKQDLNIKFAEATNKSRQDTPRKERLEVKTEPTDGEKVLRELTYTIYFSKPIMSHNLSDIQLLGDTVNTIPLEVTKDFAWNEYKTKLLLTKTIQANQSVRLLAPKGTFISVEGDTASQIKTTHELKNPENYGSIAGRIETKEPYFVIQLLTTNGEIVAEVRNQSSYRFNYLNAGEYTIRVIIDKNNNGKWDQGDLAGKRQAEPILFAPRPFKLKENWELTDQNITL